MLTSRLLIFISLFWASLGQSLAQDQNSVEDYKACVQEATENQPMTIKELNERTEKLNECMNIQLNLNEAADNQTIRGPVELSEDIFAGRKKKKSRPEAEPFKLVLKNKLRHARKYKECGRLTISYTLLPTSWTTYSRCSADDSTTKIKGRWDSGSLFTQNYDTSASGNVSSISFDLSYEIEGDSFTESVTLDPKSNEAHITKFVRGKATKYGFKIISMTPSQAKTPDKKTKWHALAELRLNKFGTAAEEKAVVITAQKETDNRNKTTTLNKVDGDGMYSYYPDGSCTDGRLTGKCISRSDFNDLCPQIGVRYYRSKAFNPYDAATFSKRQFAKVWDSRGFAGVSDEKTRLINNRCIFSFSYDGIVNGTRYSGRLACELNQIFVKDGKPGALGVSGFTCR